MRSQRTGAAIRRALPFLLGASFIWLAGCSAGDGPRADDSALVLAIPAPDATRNETITVSGTVDRVATVSVGDQSIEASGGWSLEIPLEYGQTTVRVFADNGLATATQDVLLVRLAPARITAEFTSAIPPRPSLDDELWLDIDAALSGPSYAGRNIPHPPHANVHDVLVAWEQSGRAIEYSYSESFGFGLESIEGHGALSEWCYDVNGSEAPLGITGQEFRPGDVIAWHSCVVA